MPRHRKLRAVGRSVLLEVGIKRLKRANNAPAPQDCGGETAKAIFSIPHFFLFFLKEWFVNKLLMVIKTV